jgi:hypothetical protein
MHRRRVGDDRRPWRCGVAVATQTANRGIPRKDFAGFRRVQARPSSGPFFRTFCDCEACMARTTGTRKGVRKTGPGKAGAPAGRKPATRAKNGATPGLAGLAASQRRDLAALRRLAMRLAARLDHVGEDGALAPPERLLGKSDGIVDGFDALAQAIGRIVDKERQSFAADLAQSSDPQGVPSDEQAIEHRIADELDRIAARGGAAKGAGTDRADT